MIKSRINPIPANLKSSLNSGSGATMSTVPTNCYESLLFPC